MSKRERKDEKDLASVSVTARELVEAVVPPTAHRWLRRIPTQVYGLLFGYLHFWEIARFLYASGRLGRGVLQTAYRSQLVLNFGDVDRRILTTHPSLFASLTRRMADRVTAIRIHLPDVWLEAGDTERWSALFHSDDLEIVDIRFHSGGHEDGWAPYWPALVQHAQRLHTFQWESLGGPSGAYLLSELVAQLLQAAPQLEILRLSYRNDMFLGPLDVSKRLRCVPRLRILSCPVWSLNTRWFDHLGTSCPQLERVEFTSWEALAQLGGWIHERNFSAKLRAWQATLVGCPHLVFFSTKQGRREDVGEVVWQRPDPSAAWTTTFIGLMWDHVERQTQIPCRRRLIEATAGVAPVSTRPLLPDINVDLQTERPRQMLFQFIDSATQHTTLRWRSIVFRYADGFSWPDEGRPWMQAPHISGVIAQLVPRGLNRLWYDPHENELRDLLDDEFPIYLKIDREAGDDQWALRVASISHDTLEPLLDAKQWTPGWSTFEYEAGRLLHDPLRGWLPDRLYAFLAGQTHPLRVLRLGHQRPYRPYDPGHERRWQEPEYVTFEAPSFRNLEVLDTGNGLIGMRPALWITWGQHMRHLRSLSTVVHGAITKDDWLRWEGLTTLRVRQYVLENPEADYGLRSAGWPERIDPEWIDNHTLDILCRHNAELEVLALDLHQTGITRIDTLELKRLRVLHLTLATPSVTTEQLARLKRQCPRLVRVSIRLAPSEEQKGVTQPPTTAEAAYPFLQAFAPGGNPEFNPEDDEEKRPDETELEYQRRRRAPPIDPRRTELGTIPWGSEITPELFSAWQLWNSTDRERRASRLWSHGLVYAPPTAGVFKETATQRTATAWPVGQKALVPVRDQVLKRLQQLDRDAVAWNARHPPSSSERVQFDKWHREIVREQRHVQERLVVSEMEQRWQVRWKRTRGCLVIPPRRQYPDLWQAQVRLARQWGREGRRFVLEWAGDAHQVQWTSLVVSPQQATRKSSPIVDTLTKRLATKTPFYGRQNGQWVPVNECADQRDLPSPPYMFFHRGQRQYVDSLPQRHEASTTTSRAKEKSSRHAHASV